MVDKDYVNLNDLNNLTTHMVAVADQINDMDKKIQNLKTEQKRNNDKLQALMSKMLNQQQ